MGKIYENVKGLKIDIPLKDLDGQDIPIAIISGQVLFVLRPNQETEEEWSAELVSPNIVRHTVPVGANLLPGRYRIQAEIETPDGFKGRAETVYITITARQK